MTCTSKIDLINKRNPLKIYEIWNEEKQKFRVVKEDNYLCLVGDLLDVITHNICYCYNAKSSSFSIVKNKNNDVFFLDYSECELNTGIEEVMNRNDTDIDNDLFNFLFA